MIPPRLTPGDEIRIIAPSRSLSIVYESVLTEAVSYLQNNGYCVTFSEHSRETEYADSASIESRIADIHDAFADTNVKAILCAVGGFNSNQLLEYIDYSIIKDSPKIFCGFSDITALLNAIYSKTGLVTYHGPNFTQFGHIHGREYTDTCFAKCVTDNNTIQLTPSAETGAYTVIQEGECEGVIIGGNLCTLNLLQGTDYMPELDNVILFLEDDNIMGEYFVQEFERNLQSLLQVKNSRIAGVVFGRFTEDCQMSAETITQIVKNKKQLRNIPIIFNADFGHVPSFFTFPIGGTAKISATGNDAEILITNH